MSLVSLVEYCCSQLTEKAIRYLIDERHLSEDIIDKWQIGYCPFDIGDLVNSTDQELLLKQKIVYQSEDGFFSFMQNSIVFPFVNQHGKVVAISSRPLLPNDVIKQRKLRKYWNSSFEKNWFLYGLNHSIPTIRDKDQVIIGEGQIDVLTAHQHGFTNTVGTCGTALSTKHIALLSRYASEIIVVYDGDLSGQRALSKLDKRVMPGVTLKSVVMPSGEDIDSFLLSCGREKFQELLESATKVE